MIANSTNDALGDYQKFLDSLNRPYDGAAIPFTGIGYGTALINGTGCRPLVPVDEDRVRQIIRDELRAAGVLKDER